MSRGLARVGASLGVGAGVGVVGVEKRGGGGRGVVESMVSGGVSWWVGD